MNDKFKKFYTKFVIIIVVIAMIIGIILIFFPNFIRTDSYSDRIGLAQLVMEVTGVFAILLAVWEFSKAQRKPKLELFMEDKNDAPGKFTKRILHDISSRPHAHTFRFDLWLDNSGDAPARWINIKLSYLSSDNEIEHNFSLPHQSNRLLKL